MSKVLGRTDDMLVIRGVNVFPSEVEAVLLADDLTHALRERLGITCVVRALERGAIPRAEVGKARRLVRWDRGEPPIANLN
jgi:phenylacetate-CoA ligase